MQSSFNLLSGKPNFNLLMKNMGEEIKKCGERPVLGVMIVQEPHFEYPVSFPYYTNIKSEDRGFATFSNYFSIKDKTHLQKKAYAHYLASVGQLDKSLHNFLIENETSINSGKLQIVFTSDHGEYFGEGHLFLHAGELGPMSPLLSPLVMISKNKDLFNNLDGNVFQNTEVKAVIKAAALKKTFTPKKRDYFYIETEIWPWAGDLFNFSFKHIEYPYAWDGLLYYDDNGYLSLEPKFLSVVKKAKQRRWILGKDTYDLTPLKTGEHTFTKNSLSVPIMSAPKEVLNIIRLEAPEILPKP